jgi:hypothetical protein
MRKEQLLEALESAKKEREFYRVGYERTNRQIGIINKELTDTYTHISSRYSSRELADVRRRIVAVTDKRVLSPKQIVDLIPEHPAQLIMREVVKLARNPRSDLHWNRMKGTASRYGRI